MPHKCLSDLVERINLLKPEPGDVILWHTNDPEGVREAFEQVRTRHPDFPSVLIVPSGDEVRLVRKRKANEAKRR